MSDNDTLRLRRIHPAAVLPRYASAGAAGLDLAAALDAPITIAPRARAKITTGWEIAIPAGFEGQVRPRSGLAWTHGLSVLNAPGTIDSDYRGELQLLLVNLGEEAVTIQSGDRVAQLVIAPVAQVGIEEVAALDPTERGHAGFGSTGIRSSGTESSTDSPVGGTDPGDKRG